MLQFGNKEFRNLQEQVLKNMQDIANISEGTAVLSEFGIKVVGEVDALADLPTVNEYKAAHADWEYGDAYAIGTEAPYTLVILTRANDDIDTDHWFDIGDFPAPGPTGPAGPMGETGPQGATGNPGPAGADAGFGSVLATAQTLPAGSAATATVQVAGPNTAKEFSFTFGIPRGADGGSPVWGNIVGTMSDQTDLKNALDAKQDDLVSGTNIKTINGNSVLGSGNIEINSGVWGNITGTLSNQTDLKDALDAKANSADLATVATTGDYDDLIDKPTIGSGTITIKKNGTTVDSFDVNQTADQNINIVVPTKTSDITNDSDYTTKTYVDNQLDLKADKSTTYTKTQVDTALSAKANTVDVYSKTEADNLLDDKVDKVTGYGLSENDFTDALKNKLDGIAAGAEVNVQADYAQTDNTADDYIKNKPTIGDATLTIQKNGTNVDTFTANATSNKTINITVPTNNNELTNGAGYITQANASRFALNTLTLSSPSGTLDSDTLAAIIANPDQYIISLNNNYYLFNNNSSTTIKYAALVNDDLRSINITKATGVHSLTTQKAVLTTRTINSKALSSNITLTANDIPDLATINISNVPYNTTNIAKGIALNGTQYNFINTNMWVGNNVVDTTSTFNAIGTVNNLCRGIRVGNLLFVNICIGLSNTNSMTLTTGNHNNWLTLDLTSMGLARLPEDTGTHRYKVPLTSTSDNITIGNISFSTSSLGNAFRVQLNEDVTGTAITLYAQIIIPVTDAS